MRKFIIFFCLFGVGLLAKAQAPLWRVGTALTLPKGWFDKGFFQPLRYGLNKKTELSAYTTLQYFVPNFAIKHRWYTTESLWFLSTKHGIYYPGMLLNRVAKSGMWGVLPENTEVPFLLPTYHEFLASKFLKSSTLCEKPDLLLTLKLGINFSIGKALESQMVTIDYPFVYHYTQPYYGKLLWYVGADLEGHLTDFVNFSVDLDFQAAGFIGDWAVSNKGLLVWPWTDRWTLAGGYRAHFGRYPFGYKLMVTPLVDVTYKFTFRRNSKINHGLFQHIQFKYDDFQEKDFKIKQDEYEEYYMEENLDPKRRKREEEKK